MAEQCQHLENEWVSVDNGDWYLICKTCHRRCAIFSVVNNSNSSKRMPPDLLAEILEVVGNGLKQALKPEEWE